jgi:glucose/arabinose dehydrogenase
MIDRFRGWEEATMHAFARWTGMAAALALAAGGCSSDEGGDSPPMNVPQVALKVERVFPGLTFSAPVAMLQTRNDGTRWYVVEQAGRVHAFANNNGVATRTPFIDHSARVTFRDELGLLGMAFHPRFPADPRVYLFYSTTESGVLLSRLSSFRSTDFGLTLDPTTEQVLLRIRKPEENHNGGHLAFGPDDLLYLGIGDGGGANDQHGTIGNAQKTSTLLGKMLRINVETANGYTIPPSNPFVGNTPCSTDEPLRTAPCPEIFALGFRNPFRWSFDRGTGQLWVGDVGQDALEEVDRVDLGGNYGWRCFEGTRRTTGPNSQPLECGSLGPRLQPVAEYGRSVGTTVIGGHVYRGSNFPGLVGRYIFADFGSGLIFNIDARAQPTLEITTGFSSDLSISSFGEDVNGELYVVDYGGGGLFRIRQ